MEIASEYRYRDVVTLPNTLWIAISQSGETADVLAALRHLDQAHVLATLAVCNVATSSLIRETDLALLTDAGPEIGVASTKAFTTQLTVLLVLAGLLAKSRKVDSFDEKALVAELRQLPDLLTAALAIEPAVATIAELFADKQHTLFLGRGAMNPIAMEGALKLKELSYIHAEAYPAGELKHGPLALVDESMPVVAVAPNDALIEKLQSNLSEVRARGGQLIVFADHAVAQRMTGSDKPCGQRVTGTIVGQCAGIGNRQNSNVDGFEFTISCEGHWRQSPNLRGPSLHTAAIRHGRRHRARACPAPDDDGKSRSWSTPARRTRVFHRMEYSR